MGKYYAHVLYNHTDLDETFEEALTKAKKRAFQNSGYDVGIFELKSTISLNVGDIKVDVKEVA